jgi:hypothetical protein
MEDNNINNEIQQNIDHINNNFDFKTFNKDTLSTILPVYIHIIIVLIIYILI